ncbi:hypothetical protein [Tsuneonella mangrovi]|uniref:hypothetical protein n=1 Tax=Tsuneonella mangrovi TaxID=1982042 RepID=UPI0012376D89|nr:hypothetical protein [Tsuneonella mangrovi]
MNNDQQMAARLGRFEDWTEGEIAYMIRELGSGMCRDKTERFEGYWGAFTALKVANVFTSHGDTPMANELAVAWIGALAAYALNSTYWGNEVAPAGPADCEAEYKTIVCALTMIEHAARPIQYAHGLHDLHLSVRGALELP